MLVRVNPQLLLGSTKSHDQHVRLGLFDEVQDSIVLVFVALESQWGA
jgi:hypothetical protein